MLDISDDDEARFREMAANEARKNKTIEFVVMSVLLALIGLAFYVLSLLPAVVWKYAAIAAGLAIVGAIFFFARKLVWSLAACIFVIAMAIQFPSASIIAAAIIIGGAIVASALKPRGGAGQSAPK